MISVWKSKLGIAGVTLALVPWTVIGFAASQSCSASQTRTVVRTALAISEAACLVAQSEWASSEEIMRACALEEALRPAVEQILEARRKAAKGRPCAPADSGSARAAPAAASK